MSAHIPDVAHWSFSCHKKTFLEHAAVLSLSLRHSDSLVQDDPCWPAAEVRLQFGD